MRRDGFPVTVFLLGFLAIVTFGYLGVRGFERDMGSIREASMEDITWTARQVEIEYARFEMQLLSFQIEGTETTARDVNKYFDILWSRLALFQQGAIAQRLNRYETEEGVVADLFSRMQQVEPLVVGLEDGDIASAALITGAFEGVGPAISKFSHLVTAGEESRQSEVRDTMRQGVNQTLLLSVVTILALFGGLIYLWIVGNQFRRLAATNLRLMQVAEGASRAKSKFLTMMSHEMRTPMNGVLGTLALAKQSEMNPKQRRLIEQSESSAQQMVDMLADVLEFSALQSEDLELENRPFSVKHLKADMEDRFDLVSRQQGVNFRISLDDSVPPMLRGDFKRLRQSLCHLTQYVVETAGVKDIALHFTYHDAVLMMEIAFEYLSGAEEWTPDLILGSERTDDKFASDALGPAIARGFIEIMRGVITVDTPEKNHISVHVCVPLEAFDSGVIIAKIMTESAALETICRAGLRAENVLFADPDETDRITAVFIEAGGAVEQKYLQIAETLYPNAMRIAVGAPADLTSFDLVLTMPLDFASMRESVLAKAS